MAFDHNMSKVSFEHLIGTLKRRLNKAAEKIGDMNKISEKDRLEVSFSTRDGYPNPTKFLESERIQIYKLNCGLLIFKTL